MLSLADINNRTREKLLIDYYLDLATHYAITYYDSNTIGTSFVFKRKLVTLVLVGNEFRVMIKDYDHIRPAVVVYHTLKHSIKVFYKNVARFFRVMILGRANTKLDQKLLHNFDLVANKCVEYINIKENTCLITENYVLRIWLKNTMHIGIVDPNGLRYLEP